MVDYSSKGRGSSEDGRLTRTGLEKPCCDVPVVISRDSVKDREANEV